MVGIMAEEREILPNGEQNSLNINGNDEENEEESIDGEEELDDAAFEDPEDFVDNISDEGMTVYFWRTGTTTKWDGV